METIITFDCGGIIYKISKNTLEKIPNTFFTNLIKHNKDRQDFYIDRNGENLKYIFNYYRNNILNINGLDYNVICDILMEAEYYNILPLIELITNEPYYIALSLNIENQKAEIYNNLSKLKEEDITKLNIKLSSVCNENILAKQEHDNKIIKYNNIKTQIKKMEEEMYNYKKGDKINEVNEDITKLKNLKENFYDVQISMRENIKKSSVELYNLFYKINDTIKEWEKITKIENSINIDIKQAIDYNFYKTYFNDYTEEQMYIMYVFYKRFKKHQYCQEENFINISNYLVSNINKEVVDNLFNDIIVNNSNLNHYISIITSFDERFYDFDIHCINENERNHIMSNYKYKYSSRGIKLGIEYNIYNILKPITIEDVNKLKDVIDKNYEKCDLNNYQYIKKTYNITHIDLFNIIFSNIELKDKDFFDFLDFVFEYETNIFKNIIVNNITKIRKEYLINGENLYIKNNNYIRNYPSINNLCIAKSQSIEFNSNIPIKNIVDNTEIKQQQIYDKMNILKNLMKLIN